jgi:LytR cell envelope-related transcriptional attenuator
MHEPVGIWLAVHQRRRRTTVTFALAFLLLAVSGLISWQLVNVGTNAAASYDCDTSGSLGIPDSPGNSGLPAGTGATQITPRRVLVNVYNATQRDGLARSIAVQLRSRGYLIHDVANDPRKEQVPGTAVIRFGAQGKPAAMLLATQVPQVGLDDDERSGPVIDLVLGERFKNLAPPSPACDSS